MRLPPFNPRIALTIGVIAVATTTIFVKLIGPVAPSIIASYRLLIALILLWPLTLRFHKAEFKLIQGVDWIRLIIASILFTSYLFFLFSGLNETTAVSAVLILAVIPVASFIVRQLLYNDYYSPGALISTIIVVVGLFLLFTGSGNLQPSPFSGNVFILIGLAMITGHYFVTNRLKRKLSFLTFQTIIYSFSLIFFSFFHLASRSFTVSFSLDQWLYLIGLALIPTFLGYGVFNWALRWIRSETLSMTLILEPLLVAFLSYLFIQERVVPLEWLSGSIIIFGLLLFVMSTRRKTHVTITKMTNKQKDD